jgi:hypothetical protein
MPGSAFSEIQPRKAPQKFLDTLFRQRVFSQHEWILRGGADEGK